MVVRTVFFITITLAFASGFLVLPEQETAQRLLSYNQFAINSRKMAKTTNDDDKVQVSMYYECLDPACKAAYFKLFKLYTRIGDRIKLKTYPYGNAQTKGKNVTCEHGEAECYGNKLHACAIDILKDMPQWFKYNACLMPKQSTDEAADQCGSEQKIDSAPIKECAKGERGQELLIKYGRKTPEHWNLPEIYVNGIHVNLDMGEKLTNVICEAFKNPPENCIEYFN